MPVQKYVPSYLTKFSPIWFEYALKTALTAGRYLKSEENLLNIRVYREKDSKCAVRADVFGLKT
jgi:hypothetical protein